MVRAVTETTARTSRRSIDFAGHGCSSGQGLTVAVAAASDCSWSPFSARIPRQGCSSGPDVASCLWTISACGSPRRRLTVARMGGAAGAVRLGSAASRDGTGCEWRHGLDSPLPLSTVRDDVSSQLAGMSRCAGVGAVVADPPRERPGRRLCRCVARRRHGLRRGAGDGGLVVCRSRSRRCSAVGVRARTTRCRPGCRCRREPTRSPSRSAPTSARWSATTARVLTTTSSLVSSQAALCVVAVGVRQVAAVRRRPSGRCRLRSARTAGPACCTCRCR